MRGSATIVLPFSEVFASGAATRRAPEPAPGCAARLLDPTHLEADAREMHNNLSGAWMFAGDSHLILGRRIQRAFDRIGPGVGCRHHNLVADRDAVCVDARPGNCFCARIESHADGGAAVEACVCAVAKRTHAFPPSIQRRVGLENLCYRTAAYHEPEIVINREVRNAGGVAEEEILLAEHLLETLEIKCKCRSRLRNPHARHIRAKQ